MTTNATILIDGPARQVYVYNPSSAREMLVFSRYNYLLITNEGE